LVRAHDGTYLNKNLRQGGSQGNVPQKWTLNNKTSIYFGLLIHYQEYKWYNIICTFNNGLTVQNVLSFYYSKFSFVERHLVEPPFLEFYSNKTIDWHNKYISGDYAIIRSWCNFQNCIKSVNYFISDT
jgi:hypothetical protein